MFIRARCSSESCRLRVDRVGTCSEKLGRRGGVSMLELRMFLHQEKNVVVYPSGGKRRNFEVAAHISIGKRRALPVEK